MARSKTLEGLGFLTEPSQKPAIKFSAVSQASSGGFLGMMQSATNLNSIESVKTAISSLGKIE